MKRFYLMATKKIIPDACNHITIVGIQIFFFNDNRIISLLSHYTGEIVAPKIKENRVIYII